MNKNIYLDFGGSNTLSADFLANQKVGIIIDEECYYDHFTYTTGGDFTITVMESNNFTCHLFYPTNTTRSNRSGNVTFTFYDADGGTYQQTVTINQSYLDAEQQFNISLQGSSAITSTSGAGSFARNVDICGCTIDSNSGLVRNLAVNLDFPMYRQMNNSYAAGGGLSESNNTYNFNLWWRKNEYGHPRTIHAAIQLVDTNNNHYYYPQTIRQAASSDTYKNIYCFPPDGPTEVQQSWNSTSRYLTYTESGCTFSSVTFSYDSINQFNPTARTLEGNMIQIDCPHNTTSKTRRANIGLTFMDTDGNYYYDMISVVQAYDDSGFIKFAESATSLTDAIHSFFSVPLDISGCTPDTTRGGIISVSGNCPVSLDEHEFEIVLDNGTYYAEFYLDPCEQNNKTANARVSTVTAQFYDTSGNSYTDTITVTQPASYYALWDYAGQAGDAIIFFTSGQSTTAYFNLYNANNSQTFTVDSVDKSEGAPELNYTFTKVSANKYSITFTPPVNTSNSSYEYMINLVGCYGPAAGFTGSCLDVYTPVSDEVCFDGSYDIYVTLPIVIYDSSVTPDEYLTLSPTEFNVGSGACSAASHVTVTTPTPGSYYLKEWNYTTGGSFSTTVTALDENTLELDIPQNTSSARTGTVDIELIDAYCQSFNYTVTINQSGGTSGGGFTVDWDGYAQGGEWYGPTCNIIISNSGTAHISITNTTNILEAWSGPNPLTVDGSHSVAFILKHDAVGFDTITFTNEDTGDQVIKKIYRNASGSVPKMSFNPSALTVLYSPNDPGYNVGYAFTQVVATNCIFDASFLEPSGWNGPILYSGGTLWCGGTHLDSFEVLPQSYIEVPPQTGNNVAVEISHDVLGWAVKEFFLRDTSDNLHVMSLRGASVDKDIYLSPSAVTVTSASTYEYLNLIQTGCQLSSFTYSVSDQSFPITAVQSGNSISLSYEANPNNSARTNTITFTFVDTDGNSYTHIVTITQDAKDSAEKRIYLDPAALVAQSGDTAICAELKAENCTFSSYTLTESGGTHFTSGPTLSGNNMCFSFPANPSGTNRSETFFFVFYDTDGNHYNQFFVVQQLASGETQNVPEPWNKEGDTAYTWYSDELLLNIMPSQRELSWNERTAYYPVTAHTFGTFEVRASGDCPFIYTITAETDTSFNSHSLYCHTENNSGETQLTSQIKIVAYSGDSAYSATTMLLKDPEASGWITATPDRINTSSSASSVNVYLTITNCQRSLNDEAINNDEFNRAEWVTVTLVNNTALTFNFAANMTPTTRSTYYNVCGRDHNDRLISRRVEITQASGTTGIKIIPDRTTLPKAAGSFTARVESTEAGNFSFSASPWMSITSYVPSSEKGGTLYINYSLNSGTTDRTGDIYASQQISTEPFTLTASTSVTQIASAETAYITITPPTVGVGRQAGTVEAQVNYAGLATPPAIVRDAGNMSIVSYNLDSGLITVAYGANDTTVPKSQTFLVTATTLGGQNISASFTITQGGAGQAVAPIWRDYVIDLPTPGQGYINYYISYDGTVVYTGRAYSMGQTNLEIYYNHLCKSFLSNRIDFTSGFQTVTDWLGNFPISSPELGNIASVNFFEDYSYENRHMTNTMTLNNPIINEVVDGSFVPFSFFVTGLSGEISVMENGLPATSFTISDNEQHRYFITAEQGKTYEALGTRYKAISACDARYSLYYVNSYGGVDVLPFKGRSFKKTDNITRLNYSRSFRNNTLEFENVNYMNEIKPAWELNTSFMTDEQSKKMHELVESTIVYLYDAEEQTYTPVVMTDKKLEYKTYFNQGRKFYTYTVNVEESQSRERR